MIVTVLTFTVSELFFEKGSKCHQHYSVPHLAQCSLSNCSTYTAITQAHCWSRVHDKVDILRWIYWETVIMRHHKSQYSVLTNHKFAEEFHEPPPPPPKILSRICINLKNDPNGSEKTEKTEKSHA